MEFIVIMVVAMPLAMVTGMVTVGMVSSSASARAELRHIERLERELSPFLHIDDVLIAEKTTIKRDAA
jgi:hypothetical protein